MKKIMFGLVSDGFDPKRLWCLLQIWVCVSVF
jgi:hypothetical protein